MYVYTYTTIYSYYYTIRRTNFVLDDRLLWHVILVVHDDQCKDMDWLKVNHCCGRQIKLHIAY
jgi:hypothetical protein